MVTQLGLFDQAPTLNVLRDLKTAMAKAADASGLSRDELCDRINQLADRYGVRLVKGTGPNLTMATFEKWLNPEDKERVIPAKALSVFCAATNSIEPMQVLTAPLGWRVIDEKQAKLLTWAEHYHKGKDIRAKMKKLESEL